MGINQLGVLMFLFGLMLMARAIRNRGKPPTFLGPGLALALIILGFFLFVAQIE